MIDDRHYKGYFSGVKPNENLLIFLEKSHSLIHSGRVVLLRFGGQGRVKEPILRIMFFFGEIVFGLVTDLNILETKLLGRKLKRTFIAITQSIQRNAFRYHSLYVKHLAHSSLQDRFSFKKQIQVFRRTWKHQIMLLVAQIAILLTQFKVRFGHQSTTIGQTPRGNATQIVEAMLQVSQHAWKWYVVQCNPKQIYRRIIDNAIYRATVAWSCTVKEKCAARWSLRRGGKVCLYWYLMLWDCHKCQSVKKIFRPIEL